MMCASKFVCETLQSNGKIENEEYKKLRLINKLSNNCIHS